MNNGLQVRSWGALGCEIVLWMFALLPWISCGKGFSIPWNNTPLPHVCLIEHESYLFQIAELPLMVLSPTYFRFVYFAGEGVLRVRPFFVFVFWMLLGIAFRIILHLSRRRNPITPAR